LTLTLGQAARSSYGRLEGAGGHEIEHCGQGDL
jgi:hypothetical protein